MKNKPYKKGNDSSQVQEPETGYEVLEKIKASNGLSFTDFKKIASKTDLTQKEWSDILHISERTLQRYSKDNSSFSFSVADRIIQIKKVFERGKEVFGTYEKFNRWLRENPSMLEGRLSLHSLASFDGINNVLTQIGRIEHGILA
jgi:putative toxin-antitoxin system antitoxin component (TIGR02293 family)